MRVKDDKAYGFAGDRYRTAGIVKGDDACGFSQR